MNPGISRRGSPALALIVALGACAGPARLDAPDLDVRGRAAAAMGRLAERTGASARALAHLELAWLCLWRGHGCAALASHAEAAVEGAPAMDLAQLTRALALQGEADVGRRATAWLALGRWATAAAPTHKLAAALASAAVEASIRLAALDAQATVAALRRDADVVDAVLAAAGPASRWRLRRLLRPLLEDGALAAALPSLRAADAARPRLHLQLEGRRHSPRAYAGLRPLAAAAAPLWQPRVLAADPVDASHFALPADDVGVWRGQARASLPPGRWLLVVRADASLRMRATLDGAPSFDDKDAIAAGLRALPLAGTAGGELIIDLHLARQGGDRELLLALEPAPAAPAAPAEPAAAARAARAEPDPERPLWADAAIADAIIALEEGAPVVRRAGPGERPALPVLVAATGVVGRRDVSTEADAADEVNGQPDAGALDRRLDLRDDDVDARIGRARLAREEGQTALATSLLAPLQRRLQRGEPALQRRADLHLELGWAALADGLGDVAAAAAIAAVRAQPADCPTLRAALDLAGSALERAALRRLLAAAPACPALALQRAEAEAAVGDRAAALDTLRRAAAQPALARRAAERLNGLEALQDIEDPTTLAIAATADVATSLLPPTAARAEAQRRWRAAQRSLARGEPTAAQPHLDALLLGPGVDPDLRLRALRLGARPPWLPDLVDGPALSAAFDAVEGDGADAAWLLDQELVVLLPGGGALRRVHQVARVLHAEAAGRLGEVTVGADAELELARTIDENGELLAPAHTPDKEAQSLRGVVPGATVEHAQVQVIAADDPASGATRLPVFVFGSADGPTLRGELVVYVPPGVTPQVEVSPAAPTVAEEALTGGWRRLRWRVDQAPRWRPEPRANRPERTLPTVRVAVAADLEAVAAQAEDVLQAHLLRRDPALEAWVVRARAAGNDRDAWRALVGRLARAIDDEGSAGLPGAPDRAARAGRGDRAALLWHLARRAGVKACLWRVAPWTREPPWRHADLADYGLGAVALQLRGAAGPVEVVYDGGIDGALPDVLRPGLRDRPALRLGCSGAVALRTPSLGDASDRRDVELEVRWGADGALAVEGRERLHGVVAVAVRNLLVSGDDAARTDVLRQLTSATIPGLQPRWVDTRGTEDDAAPLELRWRAEAPATAATATQLTLGLVPYRLGREYAALPSRRFPLRVGHELDVRVRLRVISEGGRLGAVDDVAVRAGGLSYSLIAQRAGRELRLEAVLRQRMGLVEPAAYPAFAAAARAVDRAELVRLQRGAEGAGGGSERPAPQLERR